MSTGSWTTKLLYILKNIGLLIAASIIAAFLSVPTGELYMDLFNPPPALVDLDFRSLIGLPLAHIFFLSLLFTAFGGKHKYWWLAVSLIPAAIVELYAERQYLYFPFLLGLAGWLLGVLILKLTAMLLKFYR